MSHTKKLWSVINLLIVGFLLVLSSGCFDNMFEGYENITLNLDGDGEEVEVCFPDCTGKTCGDDSCGGSCGECDKGFVCNPTSKACDKFPEIEGCPSISGLQNDSPWPIDGFCGTKINRSPFAAPEKPAIKWTYEERTYRFHAIDRDGTIYIGCYIGGGGVGLCAINPDGTLRWSTAGKEIQCNSMLIGKNSLLYISSDHSLYTINAKDGEIIWSYSFKNQTLSGLSIGLDGTLYTIADHNHLVAMNPKGKIEYTLDHYYFPDVPSLDSEGNLVLGARWGGVKYSVEPHNKGKLLFLSPEGELLRHQNLPWNPCTPPSIDTKNDRIWLRSEDSDYNRLILVSGESVTYLEDFYLPDSIIFLEPETEATCAIRKDGSAVIVLTENQRDQNGKITALSGKSEVLWQYDKLLYDYPWPLLVDADGKILAGYDGKLIALDSNGKLLWQIRLAEASESGYVDSVVPKAIGADGTIYVKTGRDLIAIGQAD